MLSLKELKEKTSPVHKASILLHGKIKIFSNGQACLLTAFLGTLSANLWVSLCTPRSEELPLHPL